MKRASNSVRNQRLSTSRQRKQQHLLDVKVRSFKFKQQRNRKILLSLCKLGLFASVIGGLYYGGRECMNRFFWRNPDYNLTAIEINDDGMLSREQILSASGIREGENIFAVNLSKARENLSQLPQVEHVELERMLPAKIAVTVVERKPVAWLTAKGSEDPTISDDAFLIDAKGTLIKSKKQLPEYFHLPVIYGYSTDNLEAGQPLDAPEVKAALKLIGLNSDNTRFQIRGIDLSKRYCMVVANQSHMEITFGLDRLETQLQRLGLLLDHVEGSNRIIQTANLMVERNVPVTFVQPSDEQASDMTPVDLPPEKPKEKTPPPVKKAMPAHPKLKATPMPVRKALPVTNTNGNG
jgi:cell division septal protein FtsQ